VQVPVGFARQSLMLLQLVLNVLPMLVSLIATQKTKATRRTIRVYSTRPCPSSSTINLLKSSISVHPLSLRVATKFVPILRCQRTKRFHVRIGLVGQHVPCHGHTFMIVNGLDTYPVVPYNNPLTKLTLALPNLSKTSARAIRST
jgi:hypothetical protein